MSADIAQLVERILGKDEVTGSNPVISSIKYSFKSSTKAPKAISENIKYRAKCTNTSPYVKKAENRNGCKELSPPSGIPFIHAVSDAQKKYQRIIVRSA